MAQRAASYGEAVLHVPKVRFMAQRAASYGEAVLHAPQVRFMAQRAASCTKGALLKHPHFISIKNHVFLI